MSRRDGGRRAARRGSAAALAGVLVAALLGGCGSTEEDYCAALIDEERRLARLSERAEQADGDVVTPTLESFERLQGEAPPELRDEWDTLVFAYQALVAAVERAGVDPAAYRPGERPEGVTAAQARDLAAVASKLTSVRVQEAAEGVETHALDVCEVDFGV